MAKSTSRISIPAHILDILSLATSIALLAAVTQHVAHMNQVNRHLIATYLSHTAPPGINVGPDFQLIPLAPVAALLIILAVVVRKRVSPLLCASLAVGLSAGIVWLFGFHLVHV